jgi:hypothetical protein
MKIIVHVGYPKAASSTLQKHLFSKHPEINYLGLYPTNYLGRATKDVDYSAPYLSNPDIKAFYKEILISGSAQYSENKAIALYEKGPKKHFDSSRVNLLSHEKFLASYFAYNDVTEKAKRLKQIVGKAKIIIVIRNQLELIKSQYRDWPFDPRNIRFGKTVSFHNWVSTAIRYDDELKIIKSLQFGNVAKCYSQLFGYENVKILCMEKLSLEYNEFVNEISGILSVDPKISRELLLNKHENSSVSRNMNTLRMWRRNTKFIRAAGKILSPAIKKRVLQRLETGGKADYKLNKKFVEKLQGIFNDSNNFIAEKWALPLESLGYLIKK